MNSKTRICMSVLCLWHSAATAQPSDPVQLPSAFAHIGEVAPALRSLEQTKAVQVRDRTAANRDPVCPELLAAPRPGNSTPAVAAGFGDCQVSPQSLRDTVAAQSQPAREAVATSIQEQVKLLENELKRRLTGQPLSAEVLKEIDELNKALSAKRQALDFARGTVNVLSAAAAESYANTTNPYFLMCGQTFWTPNDSLNWFSVIQTVADRLLSAGHSVGLLSIGGKPVGSGVVVRSGYVLTNRHVAEQLADHDEVQKTWTVRSNVTVEFDREYPIGEAAKCRTPNVAKHYGVHNVYFVPDNNDDVAVLMTYVDDAYPSPLTFVSRSKLDYSGNMTIAVIGYPGQPVDMTIAEIMQFFRTPVTTSPQFGYKRLSEGFTADDPVTEAGIFRHKANTSGGNSGSPIFDLKDASVVGLHSSGYSRNDSQMGINLALTSERVLASLRASGIAAPQ